VSDAEVLEAQLTENLIRAEIHPMEEAEGFRALLSLEEPKYSIEQIAARLGKQPSFVASRLKLTELIPAAVEAFYANEIGVSHALLLAKLPADQQRAALSACFKEVYNAEQKPTRILLPLRNLQFWIENNVLLVLKDAPFDKRDSQLVSAVGSCGDCPKRTGHNKLLFGDDLGRQGDRCMLCGIWATASLSCWLAAAAPTAWVAASSHLFFCNLQQEVHLAGDFVVHPIRWDRCPSAAGDPHARAWITLPALPASTLTDSRGNGAGSREPD
jgi:hypothetical protein